MGKKRQSRQKTILRWGLMMVFLLIIISLVQNIVFLIKQQGRITEAEAEVRRLEQEQADLKEQGVYFESEEYIQQQARDRLNMSRSGEAVVVLPPSQAQQETYSGLLKFQRPVWEQWLDYLGLR
ncbi:septum formation initiator family protein [Patescibacteria group bacterium]|nr:septum formation initiator family protein [Patescibacteria group bacterium]